ncbi:MAG: hypothetical protein Q7R81_03865 [Candidatus Peregrinibacteria bacterium]|nr:hypothetical protein [Candidatus Peregrinibacteria bacterium]
MANTITSETSLREEVRTVVAGKLKDIPFERGGLEENTNALIAFVTQECKPLLLEQLPDDVLRSRIHAAAQRGLQSIINGNPIPSVVQSPEDDASIDS